MSSDRRGPWTYYPDGGVICDDSGIEIARVAFLDSNEERDELGRWLAAAPELLEVYEDVLDLVENAAWAARAASDGVHRKRCERNAARAEARRDRLRAAISKARGGR